MELKLSARAKEIIGNILTKERNKLLKGADIRELVEMKGVYEGQEMVDKVSEVIKKEMEEVLGKLETVQMSSVLNFERAEEYWREGMKLTTAGK